MHTPRSNSGISGWSPMRQWLATLPILAFAAMIFLTGMKNTWGYEAILVAMLLFAFMNPMVNAMRPGMRKSLLPSVGLFAVHAALCRLMLMWAQSAGEPVNLQIFLAIVLFYVLATLLSMLFRGILITIRDL